MSYTYAQREKSTRLMIKAIPDAACERCLGSGLVDTISEHTGEIIPMLCRHTRRCNEHADRIHIWFGEMVYWFFAVQSQITREEFDASLRQMSDELLAAEAARLRTALTKIAHAGGPSAEIARRALLPE